MFEKNETINYTIRKINYTIHGDIDFHGTPHAKSNILFVCDIWLRFDFGDTNALILVNAKKQGTKALTIKINDSSKIFGNDPEKNKILANNIKDTIVSIVEMEVKKLLDSLVL